MREERKPLLSNINNCPFTYHVSGRLELLTFERNAPTVRSVASARHDPQLKATSRVTRIFEMKFATSSPPQFVSCLTKMQLRSTCSMRIQKPPAWDVEVKRPSSGPRKKQRGVVLSADWWPGGFWRQIQLAGYPMAGT